MKHLILKFMANALLYVFGLFSLLMILIGVRASGPEHGWAFVLLGAVGFVILAVMIWGRRVLSAMGETRGKS